MNHYTIYELLWLFLPVFFWRMDTGDCSGHIETEKKIRKPGTCEWSVLCDVRIYGCSYDCGTAGTDWILAFPFCGSLCNGCRVDRRTSDGVDL